MSETEKPGRIIANLKQVAFSESSISTVSIEIAQTQLVKLIEQLHPGEEIVITRDQELDADAMLAGNVARVLEVFQQGLATPEHAAFCAELRQRAGE